MRCTDKTPPVGEPLTLRFLQSWPGCPLAKTVRADGSLVSAPNATFYRALVEEAFPDPPALFERLNDVARQADRLPTTAALTAAGQRAMDEGLEQERQGRLPCNRLLAGGVGIRRKFATASGYPEPHVERSASPVLLIDLDAIHVPGDDLQWKNDLPGFARWAIDKFLPARFRGISCWASLSASAGMKTTDDGAWVIGLHLVFVAAVPLEGRERQALVSLDRPLVDPAEGKLDTSTLRCTQLYYTAAPMFPDGVSDPLPVRCTVLRGEQDTVEVELARLRDTQWQRSPTLGNRSDGGLPQVAGYEGHLSRLGDGDGLEGFHLPLRGAIASLASERGRNLDWTAQKEDLRRRIHGAPKRPGREPDIERYLSDEYLDDSFHAALEKFAPDVTAPPRYPAPTGSVDEARDTTELAVKQFLLIARQHYQSESADGEETKPPVHALETPTGIGKTRIAVVEAAKSHRVGLRIGYAVGTHALGEEVKKLFEEQGLSAHVYRGLGAQDPDAPGETMCRMEEQARILRAGGGQLKDLCVQCKFCAVCGYQRQMKQKMAVEVWIIPHNLLGHKRPAHTLPKPDILIVDESPVGALLSGFDGRPPSISADELKHRFETSGGPSIRRALAQHIQTGPLGGPVANLGVFQLPIGRNGCPVEWESLLPEDLAEYYAREVLRGIQKLPKKNITAALEIAKLNERLLLEAEAYRAIGRGGFGLRIVEENDQDGVPRRRLEIRTRRRITKDWQVPTLLMDATPRWEVYEQFWDIDHVTRAEAAAPFMSVRQVVWSASAAKLLNGEAAEANMARLRRYIEARSAGRQRVLVICQKKVEAELLALGLPPNVETTHFNANRGMDRWKDIDLMVVVGRTEPPPAAMEMMAEVVFQEPIERLSDGAYYPTAPAGLTMPGADVATPAVRASYHPDAYAEAMRWLACVAELLQSVGRGRGVNRSEENPLQVDIIGCVPLPIAVHEVLTWDEAQPEPTDVIAGRHGIVIDRGARYVASAIELLLPDARLSRTTQQRLRSKNSALSGQTPNKESPLGEWPLNARFLPGRVYVAGRQKSIRVRYERRLARQLAPGEEPHEKAQGFRLAGKTYVWVPIGFGQTEAASVYLARDKVRKRGRPRKAG